MLSVSNWPQLSLFLLNGLVATGVHYLCLVAFLGSDLFVYAGLANLLASVFGIMVSFAGNFYFVFRSASNVWLKNLTRFMLLYASLALMHCLGLFVWTDIFSFSYHFGFSILIAVQVVLTFLGNKNFVFS